MDIFFEYWKKGWKVWLMMFCINLSYFLFLLPIAFIAILLKGGKELYFFLTIILGLIFAPALTYLVFKLFYGEQ